MQKKGMTIKQIVGLILALMILIIGIGMSTNLLSIKSRLGTIFPSFGNQQTEIDKIEMIIYSLPTDTLFQYDGANLHTLEKNFQIGGRIFDYEKTKEETSDFIYDTLNSNKKELGKKFLSETIYAPETEENTASPTAFKAIIKKIKSEEGPKRKKLEVIVEYKSFKDEFNTGKTYALLFYDLETKEFKISRLEKKDPAIPVSGEFSWGENLELEYGWIKTDNFRLSPPKKIEQGHYSGLELETYIIPEIKKWIKEELEKGKIKLEFEENGGKHLAEYEVEQINKIDIAINLKNEHEKINLETDIERRFNSKLDLKITD